MKTSPTLRPIPPLRRLLAVTMLAKESSMSGKSRSVSGLIISEPGDPGGGRRPSGSRTRLKDRGRQLRSAPSLL
jgi:hypothetical protein